MVQFLGFHDCFIEWRCSLTTIKVKFSLFSIVETYSTKKTILYLVILQNKSKFGNSKLIK